MDADGTDLGADQGLGEPEILRDRVLIRLLDALPQGVAIVDARRRYRYLNPAGSTILGIIREPGDDAVARMFGDGASPTGSVAYRRGQVGREVEWSEIPVGGANQRLRLIMFTDVTAARQKERQLLAFARTASSLTYARSAASVLDSVAEEVRAALGAASCTVAQIDLEQRTVQAGTAGGYTADFAVRFKQAWDQGAPLATIDAMTAAKTVVTRHRRDAVEADLRFDSLRVPGHLPVFDCFVAAPLIVRGRPIGALTAAYPEGQEATEDEVSFLTAMADQAAIAVDNARLLAEVEAHAAVAERHRLARDLHDSVCQALFSLTLHARAAELLHERDEPDDRSKMTGELAALRELTHVALTEMRELIFQLLPTRVHEDGLVLAVKEHAAAVSARTGLNVSVHAARARLPLRAPVEAELFRIVQEALHNVVKHANSNTATVSIRLVGDPSTRVRITIADNGSGFDPVAPHPGHLGLASMRERAALIGGTVTIHSRPGHTRVCLEAPTQSDEGRASSP